MKTLTNATIGLSDMFYPVSTYDGNLDHDSDGYRLNEDIDYYIEEGQLPAGIDFDGVYANQAIYLRELAEYVERHLKDDDKIMAAFKKYGIKLNELKSWSPREYNFQGDSIDIKYDVIKDNRELLRPEIQYYIDNVRTQSGPGYSSFEPASFEEVELDDHAYFYAVCRKAGIIDDLTDILTDMVEHSFEVHSNLQSEALWAYAELQPAYIEWKAQKDTLSKNQVLAI